MKYISVPNIIKYNEVNSFGSTLSAGQFKRLILPNDNYKFIKDILDRPLKRKDLGSEVGSINYIRNSSKFFLRTKALNPNFLTPVINFETSQPILPKSFLDMNLKKGDLLISKDSNIGEAVILEKDFDNYMLSGALYKLPISKYKLYLFAFLKHNFFREQLDFIVPKSATIRHAKTLFLDCKIPFPNHNQNKVISYVEALTQSLINKESEIRNKKEIIFQKIESELLNNQNTAAYNYSCSRYNDVLSNSRLDTGIYSKEFKQIDFIVRNYKHGAFFINKNSIKSGSTPSNRLISGKTNLMFRWITPSHFSDYGYFLDDERIVFKNKINNLSKNSLLIINRTSRGGFGEYVGLSAFYDFSLHGHGHHNQGIYRVTGFTDIQLKYMTCFLNSPMIRKYCAGLSVGSKMKEIKSNQVLTIPFPNFPDDLQKIIANLYHDQNITYNFHNIRLDNFISLDDEFNKRAGIVQLVSASNKIKLHLNKIIDNIINDDDVKIDFDFFK